MNYETNIFKIENLDELSANYVLFQIIGLNGSDEDYENNLQYMIKMLSYSLKHPVTIIHENNLPHLVVRNEDEIVLKVPQECLVKRDEVVYLKKVDKHFTLDFTKCSDENRNIILRFLQFDIQSELNKNTKLWQPTSGDAFFNKNSYDGNGSVAVYNGFYIRAVQVPGGGFGFAVDITKKYIAKHALDVHLTRNEFKKQGINKSHLVYQYGNKRYEIKADQFCDLNASQCKFIRPSDNELVTLLQDTQEKFGNSMPPDVANLPDDAAVLIYRTNSNEERRVIAGLCYKVYDTEDSEVKKLHKKSIIKPFYRRSLIRVVYNNYLQNLMYGSVKIKLSSTPIITKRQKFIPPDILFGNNKTLSVRGTNGALSTGIQNLGRTRKTLLLDKFAGFYTQVPFETQYFVVPQTLYNMYGNEEYFLKHLSNQVDLMHPTEDGWKPEIIAYDNRSKKNSVEIGFEILQKIGERVGAKAGGYALVMLPSDITRVKRQHDELAALVVSECLQEYKITASIMHSDTLQDCYFHKQVDGRSTYHIKNEARGRYKGYVDGVAINQVLLNNERWPYVLNSPLHADLTIGIDVKKQIAGFTFIDKFSKNILTRFDKSTSKERLSIGQMVKMLVPHISLLAQRANSPIEKIVVHRDGRLFQTEKDGIDKAISTLKGKGILPETVSIDILEIPKHSIVPFRLFDIVEDYNILKTKLDNNLVMNPEIGSYCLINSREAFLCTTGREFAHDGSSNPLYVKHYSGGMNMEELLEDMYYLSCLAYTKPDDCSRFPITIKITDRRINTLGSNFDFEHLDILKSEHL